MENKTVERLKKMVNDVFRDVFHKQENEFVEAKIHEIATHMERVRTMEKEKTLERIKEIMSEVSLKYKNVPVKREGVAVSGNVTDEEIIYVKERFNNSLTLRELEIMMRAIDLLMDDFLMENEHYEPTD